MGRNKAAFVCTLAALAVLAMLLPLTAQADVIFPDDYGSGYITFTAGSPLTITLDAPHYSSVGSKLTYNWKWDDYTGEEPISTTSVPSVTVMPTAADHQRRIAVDVLEDGNERGGISFDFVLFDSSIPHPIVTQEHGFMEYSLFQGESVTLTVPAAKADVSGKTLVYEWFRELPDGGEEFMQATSANQLTITNDGPEHQDFWSGYFCRVLYQGEEKSAINYQLYFSVNFYFYEKEKYQIVAKENLEKVPESIQNNLGIMTVAQLELYVFDELNTESKLNIKKEDAKLYDVTLQTQEGDEWVPVTKDNFPTEGLLVILPYPEGTDRWHYEFNVAHMFEEEINGQKPGDIEYPYVEKTSEGLRVRLNGLSPVMIAWKRMSEAPAASVPLTGDSTPLEVISALLAASACAMILLGGRLRRRKA